MQVRAVALDFWSVRRYIGGMENTTVGPALTPEGWARQSLAIDGGAEIVGIRRDGNVALIVREGPRRGVWGDPGTAAGIVRPELRHALAALCLYGEPYGFTREDVEFLGMMAQASDPMFGNFARSLADRIAALLPPE
jgi:hypothetical protein